MTTKRSSYSTAMAATAGVVIFMIGGTAIFAANRDSHEDPLPPAPTVTVTATPTAAPTAPGSVAPSPAPTVTVTAPPRVATTLSPACQKVYDEVISFYHLVGQQHAVLAGSIDDFSDAAKGVQRRDFKEINPPLGRLQEAVEDADDREVDIFNLNETLQQDIKTCNG